MNLERIRDEVDKRKLRPALISRLGVSEATISRMLTGKRRLRVDQLEVIAEVMGVSPAVFWLDSSFAGGFMRPMAMA